MKVKIETEAGAARFNCEVGSFRDLQKPDAEALIATGDASAVADEPTANPIDKMTVEELKAYAAEKGIDLGDATKKADIRAAIELAGE
jgi:hypothetical protein